VDTFRGGFGLRFLVLPWRAAARAATELEAERRRWIRSRRANVSLCPVTISGRHFVVFVVVAIVSLFSSDFESTNQAARLARAPTCRECSPTDSGGRREHVDEAFVKEALPEDWEAG